MKKESSRQNCICIFRTDGMFSYVVKEIHIKKDKTLLKLERMKDGGYGGPQLGGVWEQSFSAVLEEYCSILKYCSIIYIMVFGKLGKNSVFKTEVLQIL
jgi:hypothetical protein